MKDADKIKFTWYQIMVVAVIAGLFTACSDSTTGTHELGSQPKAKFTVNAVSGKTNTYLLKSTTESAFLWQWDIGDGTGWTKGGETDTAYYPKKGEYTVKLRVFAQGGTDTTNQTINVSQDDPNGCYGNKKALTACDSNGSKTWVLNPDAGALWIGPPDFSQTWWSNSAGDVQTRSCQFNDEYTFSKDGTLERNLNGDTWVDNDNGTDPYPSDIIVNNDGSMTAGCYDWSVIDPKYSAWGSGTFDFQITGDQLTVSGNGAYLALYKAGDTNTTPVPEASITYKIMSLS
ncbi:MAG TPA: PKD domain-containing protein, partial [Balneolaceae bacterium]|nr:PKD domain-containing protein [Balneolaceae bacterium]